MRAGIVVVMMLVGCGMGVDEGAAGATAEDEAGLATAASRPTAYVRPDACRFTVCPGGTACRATAVGPRCEPLPAPGCPLLCTTNSVCVLTAAGAVCKPITPACGPTATGQTCRETATGCRCE